MPEEFVEPKSDKPLAARDIQHGPRFVNGRDFAAKLFCDPGNARDVIGVVAQHAGAQIGLVFRADADVSA